MAEDGSNPGGYRPDDPRYGLSGKALEDYYLSRPTEWFVKSMYRPGAMDKREAAMEEHLAHVRRYIDRIRFAGPLLSDDGKTPVGTMCIIELPDRASVEEFVAGDGYAKHGMLEPPEITRFVSSKRLTQHDRTPDPNLQMFVCECIDGPDAAKLRPQVAAAHHAYQGEIIERYVAHGPLRTDDGKGLVGSLFIVEVADRDTAGLLVANEPMTAANVFSEIRIWPWRYGKSISP